MNLRNVFHKARRPLILTFSLALMLVLSAQAAWASGFTVDVSADPSSVTVNSTSAITMYVHDTDQPDEKFKGALINLTVTNPSGIVAYSEVVVNESGMYTLPFKATSVGNYTFQATAKYVYTGDYGLPVGMVAGTSDKVTLSSKARLNFPGNIGLVSVTPHVILPTATPTPTASPATPTASATPGSITDTTAPVTVLNVTGNSTEAGEYVGDVICTLAAQDNEGGSGVSVIQYSFDGSNWFTYQQPLSVVKPGINTLYYRSADNAGNVEMPKVKAIIIAEASATPAATPKATATPGFSAAITAIALAGPAALLIAFGRTKK